MKQYLGITNKPSAQFPFDNFKVPHQEDKNKNKNFKLFIAQDKTHSVCFRANTIRQ